MSTHAQSNESPRAGRATAQRFGLGWVITILGAVAVGAVILLRPWQGRADVKSDTGTVPAVAVVKVDREDLYKEISVPAEFRPYADVDVHAKVSGYVKQINVDIGDRVKPGQLLAVLEIPELKDELDQAMAAERRAEADYRDMHLAYTRLVAVNKEHANLIAQQDLDTAEAKDATTEGALAAAKADVEKYQTLWGYTRITAPFGGVITKRYADPGALIQAGTASQTQAMPLVRLADNTLLRLDFPVTVDYVHNIRLGSSVNVRVESLGGRTFDGKIARFTNKVDDSTRTMIVESEVKNPTLELVPGMYATVTLKVDERPHALAIPIEAVPQGAKTVLVVNSRQQVEERHVTLGLETPAKYEVLSGLHEGDLVLVGNPGQLVAGQRVQPKLTEPLARTEP
jgi:RND family efflux transporter MFP subunit